MPIPQPSIIAIGIAGLIGLEAIADIPPHPQQIVFAPLVFEPPQAGEYRHTLDNGVAVYLAPSHEFPLINIVFTFKGGRYLDPADQVGLAAATGAMMRRGGTTTVSAQDMDEEFDFLAANASSSAGLTQSSASLNCLASNFGQCFARFIDMVRNPGFQESRLAIYKQETLEQMKQRNDHAARILSREWRFLLYGDDHFEAALPTESSIESLTAGDLQSMHRRIFHPGNLIVAVTGDFEPQIMLQPLDHFLRL